MAKCADIPRPQCPMDAILRQVTGPWTLYLLWLLQSQGPQRFGALKTKTPGIAAKVLTERLRQLERSGLIDRDYQPTIPPAVTYSLTERGKELHEVLAGLNTVAMRWLEEDAGKAYAPAAPFAARDRQSAEASNIVRTIPPPSASARGSG